jgi:hypothetical protein
LGRHVEAEALLRQALKIHRTALGEHHPQFASTLNNLAALLRALGRHAEAGLLLRQALAV